MIVIAVRSASCRSIDRHSIHLAALLDHVGEIADLDKTVGSSPCLASSRLAPGPIPQKLLPELGQLCSCSSISSR